MPAKDHRIEIYIDPVMYLALRTRVADCDRTISQHLRHLLRRDLESSIDPDQENGRACEGGTGAEA